MREKKPFKTWHLILLIIIVVFAVGKKIYDSFWPKAIIRIGGQEVRVLVADTPARRFKGWSDRKNMSKYGGMLFVFSEPGRYAMVMRGMRFPLDIVWLDGNKIIDIAPNLLPEPNVPEEKLTVYGARASSTMVLELPAGFMQKTGIKIGDKIQINPKNNFNETYIMKITSPAFNEGASIPAKYTCDGEGVNPPLEISGVPAEAKSLVLLMDDPDIPEPAKKSFNVEVWDHWVVFNMPPDTKNISEGQTPAGVFGKNTRGNLAYGGPCPPDREHRYFFKLYALDTMLNLPAGATKAEVEKAMAGHVIAQTELVGRYARP